MGREGIYVYLRLIHAEVWEKTTKFCKAIILQLKNKKKVGLHEYFVKFLCLVLFSFMQQSSSSEILFWLLMYKIICWFFITAKHISPILQWPKASNTLWCLTVLQNQTKTWKRLILEQSNDYCRAMQGDRWLVFKNHKLLDSFWEKDFIGKYVVRVAECLIGWW